MLHCSAHHQCKTGYNNKFKALYTGYVQFLACNGITEDGKSIYKTTSASSALDYQHKYKQQLENNTKLLQEAYQGYHKALKESVV